MSKHTPAALWVARAITVALWLVGSAFLVQAELEQSSKDWVKMVSIPIVWAVVITLPALIGVALRERQLIAVLFLSVGAVVGIAYTLSGTIARQSEARDVAVKTASESSTRRDDLMRKLKAAEDMLTGAQKEAKASCKKTYSDRCKGLRLTIGVYEGAVAGHKHELSKLSVANPAAGETRVSAALSAAFGGQWSTFVGLFQPALLGFTIEIVAFGTAIVGWPHRRRAAGNDNVPRAVTPVATDEDPRDTDAIVAVLSRAKSPLSNRELARATGGSEATVHRRVTELEAAGLVQRHRDGRQVAIRLVA